MSEYERKFYDKAYNDGVDRALVVLGQWLLVDPKWLNHIILMDAQCNCQYDEENGNNYCDIYSPPDPQEKFMRETYMEEHVLFWRRWQRAQQFEKARREEMARLHAMGMLP